MQLPPTVSASARSTGIGAWLAPQGLVRSRPPRVSRPRPPGGLTVTVLDTDARVPLLPSVALSWQAHSPTPERDALRVLARFESGNPRHPAVDIRGEDAAELLPHLVGLRVLLEPALMQLRFVDEPIRPRFDLEMVGNDTIVCKAIFVRNGDGRRFHLASGGWFEGAPGWHIDTSEGTARPLDRRVAPAALARLLRSPTIAEPASELIALITDGLPRVAVEMGAELPDLSQVADVTDLEPTFRLRATGSLTEVSASLTACYGDEEVEIRADGMSPPVRIIPRARGRSGPRSSGSTSWRSSARPRSSPRSGSRPTSPARSSSPRATARSSSGRRRRLPPRNLGSLRAGGSRRRAGAPRLRRHERSGFERGRLACRQGDLRERGRRGRSRRARALPARGQKFVKLSDNSFAQFDPERVRAMMDREVELLASTGKSGKLSLSQAGRVQELLQHAESATIAASTRALFEKLGNISEITPAKRPRGLKAVLRPYQERGSPGSSSSTAWARAASWRTTWARQDGPDHRPLHGAEAREEGAPRPDRGAHQRGDQLGA
jgi:hypothetical protein